VDRSESPKGPRKGPCLPVRTTAPGPRRVGRPARPRLGPLPWISPTHPRDTQAKLEGLVAPAGPRAWCVVRRVTAAECMQKGAGLSFGTANGGRVFGVREEEVPGLRPSKASVRDDSLTAFLPTGKPGVPTSSTTHDGNQAVDDDHMRTRGKVAEGELSKGLWETRSVFQSKVRAVGNLWASRAKSMGCPWRRQSRQVHRCNSRRQQGLLRKGMSDILRVPLSAVYRGSKFRWFDVERRGGWS
jgi:hypothetical protein